MTTREELIETLARKLKPQNFYEYDRYKSWANRNVSPFEFRGLRETALQYATEVLEFVEKANAPTDDEREVKRLVEFHGDGVWRDETGTIWVQQSELVNAIRRSEVPEPSVLAAVERAKAFLTDASETNEMRNRNAYGALKSINAEPQGVLHAALRAGVVGQEGEKR